MHVLAGPAVFTPVRDSSRCLRMEDRRAVPAALLLAAVIALSVIAPVGAAETLPGPIPAEVVRVIDGDTLAVRARIWLGQIVAVHVRIAGIDAPEMKARCARERTLALAARDALSRRAAAGSTVRLMNVHADKYGGRVIARVLGPSGADLATAQLGAGLARPYAGRTRQPWCPRRAG
jgi:endonuclease YncB( thermonuclease family)